MDYSNKNSILNLPLNYFANIAKKFSENTTILYNSIEWIGNIVKMIIKRDLYLKKLINSIDNKLIKIITGLRRCGKSFLLFNIFYSYLLSIGVKDESIIKIQLDIASFKHLQDPMKLVNYVKSKINKDEKYFLFIDEIQLCKEFELVLNEFLYMGNIDVYVTGSNSKFLSTDIVTTFRGRGHQIHLSPLSFKEFWFTNIYTDFNKTLEQYYLYGSMPYILCSKDDKDKNNYLSNLLKETYIKDIVNRHNIKSDRVLSELLKILASSVGSYTSLKKLTNSFKSNGDKHISVNTIKTYIDFLEDSFIIKKVNKYDIKGKRYINSPYKYYFTDLGLRNAILNFRQIEPSRLMENLIYNQLIIRGYSVDVGSIEINEKQKDDSYQRKQLECDFVINLGYERIYIQSVYSYTDENKIKQEIRPFINIKDSFKKMVIINDNFPKWMDENGILHISLKEFLLDGPIEEMVYSPKEFSWEAICKLIEKYR